MNGFVVFIGIVITIIIMQYVNSTLTLSTVKQIERKVDAIAQHMTVEPMD